MSLLAATVLSAYATLVLAVLAVVTAVFAILAFRKQAQEVRAIERQVADGQEAGRQQAKLLEVQAGQLKVMKDQLEDQRKAAAAQAKVLQLQSAELREVHEERCREAGDRQRAQAACVTAWFDHVPGIVPEHLMLVAVISNKSDQPIFDVQTFVDRFPDDQPGAKWESFPAGSSPRLTKILPPGGPLHVVLPGEAFPDPDDGPDGWTYGVRVTFTDAAEHRWQRDPSGVLTPLS